MSCPKAVYQWTEVVTSHKPHLSKPQAAVLALWSVGMVLARSCALTAVSLFLAEGLERKPNTVRQQLREWCYEAKAKRGKPRESWKAPQGVPREKAEQEYQKSEIEKSIRNCKEELGLGLKHG